MSMGMPGMAEERDADRSRRGPADTHISAKMYLYGRELVFILAILFTSYAALQNAPPKISKSPSAVPFFSRTSLVADFYHGQLSPAFERVSESDVSFVMYYAPWDSESQAMRSQFRAVAQYFYKQVYFAAINCWQPMSECRRQFSKVHHFPVLIVYTQHSKGVQYKGTKDSSHMIQFLESVLRPLERIEKDSDLVNLMSTYDAVVVGFINFYGNVGGPGFHTFYSSALRFLERDPHREIGFAVVTNKNAAKQFGVFDMPTVRLYMWNETLEFTHGVPLNPDALTKWISSSIHQVAVWVSPPGVKSLTLSPYVEEGSVFILFTPRNPLLDQAPKYQALREVALEYYNCDKNYWLNYLAQSLRALQVEREKKQSKLLWECGMFNLHNPLKSTVEVVGDTWNNDSCQNNRKQPKVCTLCGDEWHQSCHRGQNIMHSSSLLGENLALGGRSNCGGELDSNAVADHLMCCKEGDTNKRNQTTSNRHNRLQTSMLTGAGDIRSTANLMTAARQERCRRLHRATLVHPYVAAREVFHDMQNFSGLSCQTNRTLSFIAMDSLHFHQFAEGLGIDVLASQDKTAAVIFNVAHESSYVMESEYNKNSLIHFIKNYTQGTLTRSLRSSTGKVRSVLNRYPEVDVASCQQTGTTLCVMELNSDTFRSVVMDPSKNVVLLYHSPYCAFCHAVAHVYLTVARYFRLVPNLVFTRIDGENNDLPWEYTMHHYPTILFFTAQRKSESRVFSHSLPITVPNLVNFVLANLDSPLGRLYGMIGLCAGWQRLEDVESSRACIAKVRCESLEAVAATLAEYRSIKLQGQLLHAPWSLNQSQSTQQAQQRKLLVKLRLLKEIHLLLGSTDRLVESSALYKSLQESLKKFHNSVQNSSTVGPLIDIIKRATVNKAPGSTINDEL